MVFCANFHVIFSARAKPFVRGGAPTLTQKYIFYFNKWNIQKNNFKIKIKSVRINTYTNTRLAHTYTIEFVYDELF